VGSHKFSRTKLSEETVKRLKSGSSNKRLSKQIAAYLIESGKTSELNSLLRDLIELRANEDGIIEVDATSAFPIESEQKKQIESFVKSKHKNIKKIIINNRIDKNVIGGVELSFANNNIDLTIIAKLNKLKALAGKRKK
jgi:ATP synthase F1 delta subunit